MNEERFLIKGNKFYREEDLILTTDYPIIQFVVINDLIVLLYDYNIINNENIFGYDFDGGLKWRIEKITKIHNENYFTSIYSNDNKELLGYNVNGIEVTINKNNGHILHKELIK
jgi:hypothetical protein